MMALSQDLEGMRIPDDTTLMAPRTETPVTSSCRSQKIDLGMVAS